MRTSLRRSASTRASFPGCLPMNLSRLSVLDRIDEPEIEAYIQYRFTQVSATTVNRELATLRRLLKPGERVGENPDVSYA